MKFTKIAAVAIAATAMASSASAATINNTTDVGQTFNASWAFSQGGENVGATGALTLNSVLSDVWNFTLTLVNTSDAGAELGAWGFSADPDIDTFVLISSPDTDGDLTNGPDWDTGAGPSGESAGGTTLAVENCSFSGSNCNGNSSNGFSGTGAFEFELTFNPAVNSFVLSDAYTRFQSVGTDGDGSLKLLATEPFTRFSVDPPSTIPLPAAGWLLLAGIGGLAAFRRRKSV